MTDSGIIQKLQADFEYNVSTLLYIRNRSLIEEENQIVLTLNHMNGAFTVWLLGLTLSSLVFFVELLIDWHRRRNRAKKMWKMLRNRWRHAKVMQNMITQAKKVNKTKITKKRARVARKDKTKSFNSHE